MWIVRNVLQQFESSLKDIIGSIICLHTWALYVICI
jgi:hypothetical protein